MSTHGTEPEESPASLEVSPTELESDCGVSEDDSDEEAVSDGEASVSARMALSEVDEPSVFDSSLTQIGAGGCRRCRASSVGLT